MIKETIKSAFNLLGYDIVPRKSQDEPLPCDFTDTETEIIKKVLPYTMTSVERLYGLINAVRYIEENAIEGDIVECGVWKGGSMMATALTLIQMEKAGREIFLFDTYEGMPAPTDNDISRKSGLSAAGKFEESRIDQDSSDWCRSTLDEVRQNMRTTNYNEKLIHYIKGKVEDTIPDSAPDKIALLRLDTDWYESTKHELENLYPRLQEKGIIIIDDYGHWKGARKAVDEFFTSHNIKILLNRMDYTGRIGIKQLPS